MSKTLDFARVSISFRCSITKPRKENPVIRSLIVLAFGPAFPPPHFVLVCRPDVRSDSLLALPPEQPPSYGVPRSTGAVRRHFGPSASLRAASSRMNLPRGVHRDSHGIGEAAASRASSPKKGRRNGSR